MRGFVKASHWLRGLLNKEVTGVVSCGWGNGYVVLPTDHLYHGILAQKIPVNIHGGLTYCKLVTSKLVHAQNDKGHYVWPELRLADIGGWLIGFDTAHDKDNMARWPKSRVEMELVELMSQLLILDKKDGNSNTPILLRASDNG